MQRGRPSDSKLALTPRRSVTAMPGSRRSTNARISTERRESIPLLQSARKQSLRAESPRDRARDSMDRSVGHFVDRLPVQNLLGFWQFEIFERITERQRWPQAEKLGRGRSARERRPPSAAVQN